MSNTVVIFASSNNDSPTGGAGKKIKLCKMKKYYVTGKNSSGRVDFQTNDLNYALEVAGNLWDDCGYLRTLDEDGKEIGSVDITATINQELHEYSDEDLIMSWGVLSTVEA